jgi:Serine/threonine protein kinase
MKCGEYIGERYKIVRELGQGGMSRVYLAENIKLGTLWAIKEISKKNDMKVDLLAEPNILKKLNHPALPRIFDILEDEERVLIVVDYIEGESLDKKLAKNHHFSESLVIGWARQLCYVLEYLHGFHPNPIIYRDMKPSNIILTQSGDLKLIDFGIAREYKSGSDNDTVYIGTRGYAAPEQYGTGQTCVASDIYSLGMTLYHLLTGTGPNEPMFTIKPIRTINSELSPELEKIIWKCTRQNTSDRYQSVNELMEDIEQIDGKSIQSEGVSGDGKAVGELKAKPFKKLVLTVWDNYEFGCELAYVAAKASGYNVLLIDLDLLAPKADICLNVKKYPERIINEGGFLKSGLDITIDAVEKNYISPELITEASLRRKDLRNLYILTGNYKLENYEYYNDNSLIKLIDKAYMSFDLTILLANKSIYDSYTVISLSKSDFNIAAVNADLDKIREMNSYIAFLNDKQKIPMNKTKFVAFNYNNSENLGLRVVEEATQGNLLGQISKSKKRNTYRNLKLAYSARMEKEIIREYMIILRFFNILQKQSVLIKLMERLIDLRKTRRLAKSACCKNSP